MASIILGAVGAAVGGYFGNPELGYQIGSALGGMLEKGPNTDGPRISDLKVQGSTYGAPIPIYYGTARGSGQVIWSSDLIEHANEEDVGGKGGGPTYTSYTYSVHCAVAICEGPISGVSRIWANGELIYDSRSGNTGPTGQSPNVRVYLGDETQLPDSLLESYLGAGNVPAHRGLAYVVFQDFQLEKYGNRPPNFTFEVVGNGATIMPTHTKLSEGVLRCTFKHPFISGVYLVTQVDAGVLTLHVIDAIARTDRAIPIPTPSGHTGSGFMTYVDFFTDPITGLPSPLNEIWVCMDRHDYDGSNEVAVAFDATSLQMTRRIIPTVNVGYSYIGKNIFDKANGKVLFATSGSTINAGCRYLDPFTLLWDVGFGTNPNWFNYGAAIGDNSFAMVGWGSSIAFFNGGFITSVSQGGYWLDMSSIAYDSSRNRYACWSRNESGFAVFRTIKDTIFSVEDIYTTNTGLNGGYLNYWPVSDKYMFRAGENMWILNAETFQIEKYYYKDIHSNEDHDNFELPEMPDYFVGYVNNRPTSGMALIPLEPRLTSSQVNLASIVTDICGRTDLVPADIDVTQLTDLVDGYIITQQMTGRAAIESLQAAYFFDAVESD